MRLTGRAWNYRQPRTLRPARPRALARHHDLRRARQLRRRRRRPTSPAPRARSTWPSTPASTSSTPPTSTRAGLSEEIIGEALDAAGRRDRVAARDEGAHADGRRPERRRPLAPPPHRRAARRACAACAPTTSTSTRCTSGTASRRSRRRSRALDDLVRSGKVRYVGCSNYAGWQLMKALGISERHGFERFVSQQIHYSLQAREAEYELVPAGLDQGVGDHGLEPARAAACCPASTAAASRARRARASSPTGTSRRSATPTRCTTSSTCSSRSPRAAASRPRRSRSRGCSAAPACRPS